jgi:hypothetical protein
MNTVIRHLTSGAYWWGVATVVVGLWLWKNYGDRLPRLPAGSEGG